MTYERPRLTEAAEFLAMGLRPPFPEGFNLSSSMACTEGAVSV